MAKITKRTGTTRFPKSPPRGGAKKAPTPTGAKKNRRSMGYNPTTAQQVNNTK